MRAPVALTCWGSTRIPKLESSVILSPPCFRVSEGSLKLSFALSIYRQTSGMLRRVCPVRRERAQHDSTHAQRLAVLIVSERCPRQKARRLRPEQELRA